jgi:polyribonucleotide nucleotidyltransferase
MFVGVVVRIMPIGAFVEFAPGKSGMIHISKLADRRVEKVEDVVNIGDKVKVEIIKISEKGVDLKLLEKLA